MEWKWHGQSTQQSSSMMEKRPADQLPRPKDIQLMVEQLLLYPNGGLLLMDQSKSAGYMLNGMEMAWSVDTTIFQHDGKASSRSASAPKRYPANGRTASIISKWWFIVDGSVEIGWVHVEWNGNGMVSRHNNLPA